MKHGLAILFGCLLAASAFAQSDRDFYWWNTTSLNVKISEVDDFIVSTKTHYNQSQHQRELTYIDLAGVRQLNDWFKMGLALRFVQRPQTGSIDYEYRPQVYAIYFNNQHALKYRSTLRFEQRWFEHTESHQRLLHSFFVDFPRLSKWSIQPKLGEELFYKVNGDGFHLARLYGGFGVFSSSNLAVELLYVWQDTKRAGDWQVSDVVALNLKFKISLKRVAQLNSAGKIAR